MARAKWLLAIVVVGSGCPSDHAERAPPPKSPTSNAVTPQKVEKKLDEAEQAHEKAMDDQLEKAK